MSDNKDGASLPSRSDSIKYTADTSELDEDDQFSVISELTPIATSWNQVGQALRLPTATLTCIEGTSKQCMNQVVGEWFKKKYNVDKFGPPCWQMVVEAVRHPAGGDNPSLAEHIAKQFPRKKIESAEDHTDEAPVEEETSVQTPERKPKSFYDRAKPNYFLKFDWYHGTMSRDVATKKLKMADDGSFLVRESNREPGLVSLSFIKDEEVYHYQICRGADWYELDGTLKKFTDIEKLIEYFQQNSVSTRPEDCLKKPCPRNPTPSGTEAPPER